MYVVRKKQRTTKLQEAKNGIRDAIIALHTRQMAKRMHISLISVVLLPFLTVSKQKQQRLGKKTISEFYYFKLRIPQQNSSGLPGSAAEK